MGVQLRKIKPTKRHCPTTPLFLDVPRLCPVSSEGPTPAPPPRPSEPFGAFLRVRSFENMFLTIAPCAETNTQRRGKILAGRRTGKHG